MLGSENLKQSGKEQHDQGVGQKAAGQLYDYAAGIGNRVARAVNSAISAVMGDQQGQASAERQHDTGKTLQRGVETEAQQEADARK